MGCINLNMDVFVAAQLRIQYAFDRFERICVSFSGGKDSTVMLHMVAREAIERGRKIGVLFIDLEGQYRLTIEHIEEMYELYADVIEPYWVALPLHLRNAVSQYEPHWMCWDPDRASDWIRTPPEMAITDTEYFPFFKSGMEFEEFTVAFAKWYSQDELTACFVGIRTDESLNRYRSIMRDKRCYKGRRWTTYVTGGAYNAYPIYDWRTRDVWIYQGRSGLPYNRIYDLMHKAGLTIHQQRICQPYGDDQRRGLWLFHLLEPETWARIVARVNGANAGALYARDSGNITGMMKITLPEGHTWESFAHLLLGSQPAKSKEHYENKIAVFLHWWQNRGYPDSIPDEADPKDEASKKVPSWRRICKTLLRNDYWCKGLSFTQHNSKAYEKYLQLMKRRRAKWNLI